MVEFFKDRILLFVLIIAGDWVSLSAFIKADEIRQDAITIAIAVSLLPSLVISLLISNYFKPRIVRKKFIKAAAVISLLFWGAFVFTYFSFNKVNNQYGKVYYPVDLSVHPSRDSVIVGGCTYTPEAQAEVDDFAARKRTLTPTQLFEDFNYDISQIWTESERDCARTKILNAFAIMLLFLIMGITLTCEILIGNKKVVPKN